MAQHLADESPPVPKFLYYLSAFVSSARSVPWVMRSEYAEVPGWERWFEGEEQLVEEQELLDSFTNLPLPSEGPEALPAQHRTSLAIESQW